MADRHGSTDADEPPPPKRPYTTPTLREFGTVKDLTRTGGGSTTESGVGGKKLFRP